MTKRILTEDEANAVRKAMRNFERAITDLQSDIREADFNLSEVLPRNYRRKQEELIHKKREINTEISDMQQKILILKDQLDNGVTIKSTGEQKNG